MKFSLTIVRCGLVVGVFLSLHMILDSSLAVRVMVFQQICCAHDDSLIKAPMAHMILLIAVTWYGSTNSHRRPHFIYIYIYKRGAYLCIMYIRAFAFRVLKTLIFSTPKNYFYLFQHAISQFTLHPIYYFFTQSIKKI